MRNSLKINAVAFCLKGFLALFCGGCATSFPIYDANILQTGKKQVAVGVRYNLTQDIFSQQNKTKVDSAVSGIFKQFMYGSPATSSITFGMNNRFEVGFGVLGAFQKYAIVAPHAYDKPGLANIAVTQTFNIGFSLFPDRYYGMESNGGVLFGLPFTGSFSLTTGILGKMSVGELMRITADTSKDTVDCWRYSLTADREQVVIPLTLIWSHQVHCGVAKAIRCCLGTEIPFDVAKSFLFERDLPHGESTAEELTYVNKHNVKLIFSIGFVL